MIPISTADNGKKQEIKGQLKIATCFRHPDRVRLLLAHFPNHRVGVLRTTLPGLVLSDRSLCGAFEHPVDPFDVARYGRGSREKREPSVDVVTAHQGLSIRVGQKELEALGSDRGQRRGRRGGITGCVSTGRPGWARVSRFSEQRVHRFLSVVLTDFSAVPFAASGSLG
ncbi:hypothetical protein PVAG01_03269 [Phlyctema vagabunda]|uniref:Uncharacterized protein n=1 Tax=Phlyctema vagabunda TaxID=108571 RepID=A0ABR4PT00_9HELO